VKQPAVTLTDYGLALESAALGYRLGSGRPARPLRHWMTLFFGASSAATLLGGTVHGFFPEEESGGHRVLWPATMLSTGVAALAGWAIAGRLWYPPAGARRVTTLAIAEFAAYSAVVLTRDQRFLVAAINNLPPAFFLGASFARLYGRFRRPPLLMGLGAIGLMLVAAGAQQRKVRLRFVDHNVLFHLLQGMSLLMLFRTFGWLLSQDIGTVRSAKGGADHG
jgi:uncharacterized protein DUF6962